MSDPQQQANDGLWLSLVKHFGLYGTPSKDDDSTLDVDFRKKAQTFLPEIEKTWVVDDWTLPAIQNLPAKVEAVLAQLNNPIYEPYPISTLRTSVPPCLTAVSAIKNGDLMIDAAKAIDAVHLLLVTALKTTFETASEVLESPEAKPLSEAFNAYTDTWDKVKENLAQYFFSLLQQKAGGGENEE